MIIMIFLVFSMWSVLILLDYYVGYGFLGFVVLMFIFNLVGSFLIIKVVISFLVLIFRSLDIFEELVDYIG